MSGVLNLLAGGGGAAAFSPTSTESANFLTRATTITDTTDKTRYDALITGLVTDTDFAKLDALYILAAPDRTAAVLNLIQNAYNATEHGITDGSNFAAHVGYTGDGATFYLDTGFNASSASSPQYVLDSASLGIYVQSDITSGGSSIYNMGASQSGHANIGPFYFGNSLWTVNNVTDRAIASTTTKGLWISSRTGANDQALYRNESTTAVDSSGAAASTSVPIVNFYVFGNNESGTPSNFSAVQMSAAFIGGGLSLAAMARVSARLNTFMTAYSIAVY